MARVNISRLNQRIKFGHGAKDHTTVNGILVEKFVEDIEVWGGLYSHTFTQQLLLAGQQRSNSQTFIVRHNEKLQNCTLLQYKGVTYSDLTFDIATIDGHNSFDLITGKRSDKRE